MAGISRESKHALAFCRQCKNAGPERMQLKQLFGCVLLWRKKGGGEAGRGYFDGGNPVFLGLCGFNSSQMGLCGRERRISMVGGKTSFSPGLLHRSSPWDQDHTNPDGMDNSRNSIEKFSVGVIRKGSASQWEDLVKIIPKRHSLYFVSGSIASSLCIPTRSRSHLTNPAIPAGSSRITITSSRIIIRLISAPEFNHE